MQAASCELTLSTFNNCFFNIYFTYTLLCRGTRTIYCQLMRPKGMPVIVLPVILKHNMAYNTVNILVDEQRSLDKGRRNCHAPETQLCHNDN